MALIKGTNSYVDVAEADAYFADRVLDSDWTLLSTQDKEQALVSATDLLDDQPWTSVAISSSALAFPRIGTYYDPSYGMEMPLDPVPVRILDATCLYALHIATNKSTINPAPSSGGYSEITVGPITLKGAIEVESKIAMPTGVRSLIRPLLVRGGSATWFRSN